MGCNPGRTEDFEYAIQNTSKRVNLNGLPPHLQVVNKRGQPASSLRRQFCPGKAPKKKRGR